MPKTIVTNTASNPQASRNKAEVQGAVCKYYQSGKCSHKFNHTTSGQLYKHICSYCHASGKKFPHPSKDCRNKRQQDAKNVMLTSKVKTMIMTHTRSQDIDLNPELFTIQTRSPFKVPIGGETFTNVTM